MWCAGIEGTISQGVRGFDLRWSRYIGVTRTRLQRILSAAALNFVRVRGVARGTPSSQAARRAVCSDSSLSSSIRQQSQCGCNLVGEQPQTNNPCSLAPSNS